MKSFAKPCAMLLAVLGLSLAAAAEYEAMDLGGPAPAQAFDVSPSGRIVGSVTVAALARAVVWNRTGDAPLGLPLPSGTNWSRAFGINGDGQIVGQAQDRTVSPVQVFAVFWPGVNGSPVLLADGTVAVAVNSLGGIAGNLRTAGGSIHAALWPDAATAPVDLGTLGGVSSSAAGLNSAAQVVGQSRDLAGQSRATFWNGPAAPPIDLGAPAGAVRAAASGINDRGEIVGDFGTTLAERRALYWPAPGAVPVELQTLGGVQSQAVAVNERGWIVGWAATAAAEQHPCIWMSPTAAPLDLASPVGSGGFARAISARAQIVGDETRSTGVRPISWRRSP